MSTWCGIFAFLIVLLAPVIGRADVSPPDLSGCTGKKVAADCMTDDHVGGQCAEITWSFINYGPHGPDGSRTEKMLACKPSPPLFGDLPELPVKPLLMGFGLSVAMVATGVFLVMRRRKRSG